MSGRPLWTADAAAPAQSPPASHSGLPCPAGPRQCRCRKQRARRGHKLRVEVPMVLFRAFLPPERQEAWATVAVAGGAVPALQPSDAAATAFGLPSSRSSQASSRTSSPRVEVPARAALALS